MRRLFLSELLIMQFASSYVFSFIIHLSGETCCEFRETIPKVRENIPHYME